MARQPRVDLGGYVYHVINRANARAQIFSSADDYRDFEYLLTEACEQFGVRVLAYVIMPNHWHLLLHPVHDKDMSKALQWLGTSHARRVRVHTGTIGSGHLYQGRYKSFLVQDDTHLLTVLKYIERNPVRSKLSKSPADWRWGSAYRRIRGTPKEKRLIGELPVDMPRDYKRWVNDPDSLVELEAIRLSVSRGFAYGENEWIKNIRPQ